jgi:membrane fusion protein (multidrug efflux system)
MRKNFVRWSIVAVFLLLLAGGGYWYYRMSVLYPSTEDAYVGAHTVAPAPEVPGRVVATFVHDHERVRRGDLLFALDPTPYRIAVEAAEAALARARSLVHTEESEVAAARAALLLARATLLNATKQARRATRLLKSGDITRMNYDDATTALAVARARVSLAEANLRAALNRLVAPIPQNPLWRQAEAALARARWRFAQTEVRAGCSGTVTSFSLRPGDVLAAGESPFNIVCRRRWWVTANYKETDLSRIRPGQPARVHIDMYPGVAFRGRVVSIAPAAGAAFSLLPPENATGNWVKVTQRVPVRVLLTAIPHGYALHIGTSASVTVDTVARRRSGVSRTR